MDSESESLTGLIGPESRTALASKRVDVVLEHRGTDIAHAARHEPHRAEWLVARIACRVHCHGAKLDGGEVGEAEVTELVSDRLVQDDAGVIEVGVSVLNPAIDREELRANKRSVRSLTAVHAGDDFDSRRERLTCTASVNAVARGNDAVRAYQPTGSDALSQTGKGDDEFAGPAVRDRSCGRDSLSPVGSAHGFIAKSVVHAEQRFDSWQIADGGVGSQSFRAGLSISDGGVEIDEGIESEESLDGLAYGAAVVAVGLHVADRGSFIERGGETCADRSGRGDGSVWTATNEIAG